MATHYIPTRKFLDLREIGGSLSAIAGNVAVACDRLSGDWTVDAAEVIERLGRLRTDARLLREAANQLDLIAASPPRS